MRWSLSGKKFIGVCWIAFLLTYWIHPTAAAVTVEPLKMEQGTYLAATIPQYSSGMDAVFLSGFNESYRQVVLAAFSQFEPVALEMRASRQIPDHMKNALTFRAGYEIFRNDSSFVSLTQTTYQYTGGAHGSSRLSASTVRLETGLEVKLPDLFLDGADFTGRLSEGVLREGAVRKLPLWGFTGVRPDAAFYLTDAGLVLFFQQYEIAPYSEGIVRILYPYRELSDILQPGVGK
jgi:hypothetical protein